MSYFKNKFAKINTYTLVLDHWTDNIGNRIQPVTNPATAQFLDLNLRALVAPTDPRSDDPILVYPKIVPGFIPDLYDTATRFNEVNKYNDPFQFNTSFCSPIPSGNNNVSQSRKGNKVCLTSIYINGQVGIPVAPILNNALAGGVSQSSYNDAINKLRTNQVTYYLIFEDCRELNAPPPQWREILDVNPSTKVFPKSYYPASRNNTTAIAGGDRINGLNHEEVDQDLEYDPSEVETASCRFPSPIVTINVNNREKYVILGTYTYDLDLPNSQFNIKIYEKMKVVLPRSGNRKKQMIQTVFNNNNDNSLLTNVTAGAVYLVRMSYGIYNPTLLLNGTGTTNAITAAVAQPANVNTAVAGSSSNSYLDMEKIYPRESFTMKTFYYDI